MTQPSRSWLLAGACIVFLLAARPLAAQVVTDVPLPAGLPVVWEGAAFSDSDSIAVTGGGAIHSWTHLLSPAPQHHVIAGFGAEMMTGPWSRLGASRAAYRALGADGVPNTSDDPLMLVTRLPDSPALLNTGITGIAANFLEVTESTAVRADASGFVLLRHSASQAILEVHGTPRPLVTDPAFAAGRSGAGSFAALDAGADGLAGTPDDGVVVLSDVDGTPLIVSHSVPAGSYIRGLRVLESGVAVVWWDVGLPTIRLAVLDLTAPTAWTTFDVSPPAQPDPGAFSTFGVSITGRDSVKVTCSDDLGPGEGHALVADIHGGPVVVGSWYDDWNSGQSHEVVSSSEVMTWSGMDTSGYTYTDYGAGVSHVIQQAWSDELIFKKPATPTLVAFSDQPAWMTPGGMNQARTAVFAEAHDPGTEQDFIATGRWAGAGYDATGTYWGPRVETLAPGLVAGFLGDATGALHTLRVVTVPSASIVAPGSAAGSAAVALSVPGGVPGSQGSTLAMRVDAPPTWASLCSLYVSTGLLGEGVGLPSPMFVPGSMLHLNLTELAFVWPVQLTSGSGTVTFQVANALQLFAGHPFYVQGVVEDAGAQLNVSAALQVVIN